MANREHEEALGLQLVRRAYLYGVFHLAFGGEPTDEGLRSLFGERTREALAYVCSLLKQPELQEVAERPLGAQGRTLAQWACEGPEWAQAGARRLDDPAFLEELRSDYTKLLQVPGEDYVHPWESPYVGKESMIFQESTIDVRSFYHDAGFRLAAEKRFPDDHIGAMMDYLARQAMAAYDAFADGDDAAAARLLTVQWDFLQKHVLSWVDDFATAMLQHDARGYYGTLAAVMAAFARADEACLGPVIEELG